MKMKCLIGIHKYQWFYLLWGNKYIDGVYKVCKYCTVNHKVKGC